ncbi:hypothetical protein D3C85_1732270 [compost metagenome]
MRDDEIGQAQIGRQRLEQLAHGFKAAGRCAYADQWNQPIASAALHIRISLRHGVAPRIQCTSVPVHCMLSTPCKSFEATPMRVTGR